MKEQIYAFIGIDPIVIDDHKVVLAQRGPEAEVEIGKWHIPGALVKTGERLEDAIKRSVREKTGLEVEPYFNNLENSFIRFYDNPSREPRYHDIAFSFLCKVVGGTIAPGPRMTDVRAFSVEEIEGLEIGFDHKQILFDGLKKLGLA